MVLDAEVVHDQDKGNRARGVTEKTGGKGLVKVESLKVRDESEIGELTCLFEAVLHTLALYCYSCTAIAVQQYN